VFSRSDDKQQKIDLVKGAFANASIDHVCLPMLSEADVSELKFPMGIKLVIKSAIQALQSK